MLKRLMKAIVFNYDQNWIIDNIPVIRCYRDSGGDEHCPPNFPIGCYVTKNGQIKDTCNMKDANNDTFYVFNHLDFEITYRIPQNQEDGVLCLERMLVKSFQRK